MRRGEFEKLVRTQAYERQKRHQDDCRNFRTGRHSGIITSFHTTSFVNGALWAFDKFTEQRNQKEPDQCKENA